jgi:hypothetical protein
VHECFSKAVPFIKTIEPGQPGVNEKACEQASRSGSLQEKRRVVRFLALLAG